MSDVITIHSQDVRRGEHALINLSVARLPSHTMIDLPVYVFRAKEKGPVLLLSAGLHGDELNGIEIVRRMIASRDVIPDAGTVIAMPVVNIYGFLYAARDLPDGKDLNRSFPGSRTGSLARRVAYAFMREVVPHVDYGIDFHTGGAKRSNYPHTRCITQDPVNVQLAQAFGAPFLVHSNFIDRSFRKESYKIGKQIIVYEGGESSRFDEWAIAAGIEGTLRLMRHLRMISRDVKPGESTILNRTTWVRARYAGLFRSVAELGTHVKRKQVIASITDPFGETEYEIKSPEDGYVIALNNLPVINQGDALFHLGMPSKDGPPPI